MAFTDRQIKALQARETRYDVMEGSGSGFGIMVSPTGCKTWFLRYRQDGKQQKITLGRYPQASLAQARQNLREQLQLIGKGVNPLQQRQEEAAPPPPALLVSRLASLYIEQHAKPNKRSWPEDQRILDRDVLPAWANIPAQNITRANVRELLNTIKGRGAPIQANRTLALVRTLFNWAVSNDFLPFSPCQGVAPVSQEIQRDRVLSPSEIKYFWNSINTPGISDKVKTALCLQLLTAQRIGEVIGMRWDELQESWWVIPGERTKNGQPHRVFLTPWAQELIQSQANPSPFVFPSPSKPAHILARVVTRALHDAIASRQINPWTPHDLRRTAASHMASMGIFQELIGKILNHSDSSITAIYNRYSYDNEKQRAMNLWAERLKEMVDGE